MPTLCPPNLSVAVADDLNHATVRVQCTVVFTEFEVNAMNRLGLRYSVQCRVVNTDLGYEADSVVFDQTELPREPGAATVSQEVVFETVAPADSLREHVLTPDQFFAEITLINRETGAEQVVRGGTIKVDLAA